MFGANSLLTKSPSQLACLAYSSRIGVIVPGARRHHVLLGQPRRGSTGLLLGKRRIGCEK